VSKLGFGSWRTRASRQLSLASGSASPEFHRKRLSYRYRDIWTAAEYTASWTTMHTASLQPLLSWSVWNWNATIFLSLPNIAQRCTWMKHLYHVCWKGLVSLSFKAAAAAVAQWFKWRTSISIPTVTWLIAGVKKVWYDMVCHSMV